MTVFRFCRRARFSLPAALKLLHATLEWRLSSLSLLSPSSVSPLYLTHPLFFFHSALSDRFGRPCAVLNLRYAKRTEDGELDALKDFIRLSWETGRRWLSELSKERKDAEVAVQMVLIVDLGGAGMSNLVRSAATERCGARRREADAPRLSAGGRTAALFHGPPEETLPFHGWREYVLSLFTNDRPGADPTNPHFVKSLCSTTAGCTRACGS